MCKDYDRSEVRPFLNVIKKDYDKSRIRSFFHQPSPVESWTLFWDQYLVLSNFGELNVN